MRRLLALAALLLSSVASATPAPYVPAPYAFYDIRLFGQVGDTNSAPAVQRALDTAAIGGGTVYFPPGNWPVKSNVTETAVVSPSARIRLTGDDGARLLVQVPASQYAFSFNHITDLEIDHLTFDGVSGTTATDAVFNFFGSTVNFHDCQFERLNSGRLLQNIDGTLFVDHLYFTNSNVIPQTLGSAFIANDSNITGWHTFKATNSVFGDTYDAGSRNASFIYFGDIVTHAASEIPGGLLPGSNYEQNAIGGPPVMPMRFVSDQSTVEIGYCKFQVAQLASIKFNPTTSRYRRIHLHDLELAVEDSAYQVPIEIRQADYVRVERVWNGVGGVATFRPGIDLVDAGHVIIEHSYFDGDDLYRPPVQGSVLIQADSATKSLDITDSFSLSVQADCPTTIRANGIVARLRQATSVIAGSLVKMDPANPGHVVTPGASDGTAVIDGVALDSTAAASGTVTFNASLNITEGDFFALNDGVNSPKTITFTLVGTGGRVSVNNGMTADQRATALANFINAAHGSGFRITATAVGGGTGQVSLVNDAEGILGNHAVAWLGTDVAGNISVVHGSIVVIGMAGGQTYIRVAELSGQEVTVNNDGHTSPVAGDLVAPSTNVAGAVVKTVNAPSIGVATSSVLFGLVTIVYNKGSM